MNYAAQQRYLSQSRVWGMVAAVGLLGIAAAGFVTGQSFNQTSARVAQPSSAMTIISALIVVALAISIFYTPDYLQLTVNSEKRPRWQIKIRWRVIAAVLVLGLIFAHTNQARLITGAAVAWLIAANLLAKKAVSRRYFAVWFWLTDLALIAVLLLAVHLDLALGVIFLAAAAHLSIVISDKNAFPWAGIVVASALLLVAYFLWCQKTGLQPPMLPILVLAVAALDTAWLVQRAQAQHKKNVDAAMNELMEFTGYSVERVSHLWSISNQELAKNWEAAGIADNDSGRMVEWYRLNSELYMFAISAYNLEYKRIISNLKMLRYAKGACLDYGAGNGELVLEMARRGHPSAYYDVDGVSMKFARYRATKQNLDVKFASSKEQLTAVLDQSRLDTIFSFDVLEHLPDLQGELSFLSSLLNPGGLLVFDLPAGSTKAHPMHLNHNLDFRAHLRACGMEEMQSLLQRLPFWKQEKYVFRREGATTALRHPAS